MSKAGSRKWIGRPSPAMVIAVIALIAALSGSAIAAHGKRGHELGKNTVGSRQLKKKAVTTGKLANNAVNGRKVANGSLTGSDINLAALGKVPSAAVADSAGNANTVSGHAAACPPATSLIRGLCFDSAPGPQLPNINAASDYCAAKGGYLPSPMQLYSVRGVINLGTGIGNDRTFTDSYYYNATTGDHPSTVLIEGSGALTQQPVTSPGHAVCLYPLVR